MERMSCVGVIKLGSKLQLRTLRPVAVLAVISS
ncbi:hypothetical protein COLO4_19270 [Corchorus olitorius]|uniref:Uncharacterized protein n=1 Tax=Corchorus olitorius TaxID=93759 RepID=A0A1R3J639_9ROSI|nr:hypothetical protein COLO4_19270 [Corchorus olitorius]